MRVPLYQDRHVGRRRAVGIGIVNSRHPQLQHETPLDHVPTSCDTLGQEGV